MKTSSVLLTYKDLGLLISEDSQNFLIKKNIIKSKTELGLELEVIIYFNY